VCAPSSPDLQDMVYPLARKSLLWIKERDLMSRTCRSEEVRVETLRRLAAGDKGFND